jgi:glutamate-5-semialdehyde dehydrogenase
MTSTINEILKAALSPAGGGSPGLAGTGVDPIENNNKKMNSINEILKAAHQATVSIQNAEDGQIKNILFNIADELIANRTSLLEANAKDLSKQSPDNPRNDRLMLNEQRIKGIAESIRKVANLPDPTGKIIEKRILHNGLNLQKIAVPLGVVGAIYESRPNVTFDIAALCLRSRNVCVLKGSSDAENSNEVAVQIIKRVLNNNEINPDVVTLLPAAREIVEHLFTATKFIDVIIPRGSDSLIQYVRKNSLVPVIETGCRCMSCLR